MATIRIPTDQADMASALGAASAGDTIVVELGVGQTDFTATVNNLTIEAAVGEDFTVTLGPGVTQLTSAGAGNVDIVGNNAGNTITDSTTSLLFNEITLGTGTDTVIGGRGTEFINLTTGNKAVDLGSFADRNNINADDGEINLSDQDFLFATTTSSSIVTIVSFEFAEDQSESEQSDRIFFGGVTRATLPGAADFFVGKVTGSGESWDASFAPDLVSLGGYTDGTDWELSVAFDHDGNGTYDSVYTFHDVFDATDQTAIRAALTNTNFATADAGTGLSQIAAADEAALLSTILNPNGNDSVAAALLVDPSRNAADDGQFDLASGLIAFSSITAALTVAGEGDALVLAPGDHTAGGTLRSVNVDTDNLLLRALTDGPMILPELALGASVRTLQSDLDSGALAVTGSAGGTEFTIGATSDLIAGGAGADTYTTLGGVDVFNGQGGDDTAAVLLADGGRLTFDGGETGETRGDTLGVNDIGGVGRTIAVTGSASGVSVEATGDATPEATGTNVEILTIGGGLGDDNITISGDFAAAGFAASNPGAFSYAITISAGGGNDVVDASGVTSTTGALFFAGASVGGQVPGNHTLIGTPDADLFFEADGGTNSITGGGGNDQIIANVGTADTAHYALSSSNYVVTETAPGTFTVRALNGLEGTDTLSGIETLSFNNGAETGKPTDFLADARSDFGAFSQDDVLFKLGGFTLGQTVAGLGKGALAAFLPNDRSAKLVGDFDGDNRTEILSELNGSGAYVLVQAFGEPNAFLGQADRTAKAVGDFDGDGDDDILFTLDAGGHHVIGKIGDANQFIGRNDRSVQATGDFDGDGDDDILMKLTAGGAHVVEKIGQANVFLGGADRTARAVGDFDGDGDDDILMEINATGDYVIERVGEANVFVGRSDRTVVGVGDFDGDGDDDILFELDANGLHVIEKIGEANVFVGRADRTVRAIGDFDGDGDDDILMEIDANDEHVVEKIGEANEFLGFGDRNAIDIGLTDLGLAFEVI